MKSSPAVAAAAAALALFTPTPSPAATLFWSGNGTVQGGAGTWDTTNARWGTVTGGPFTTIWNNANGDTATFDTTAGAVALTGPITVGTINTSLGGYSIGNGNGVTGAANTLTFVSNAGTINTTHTSGTTSLTAFLSGQTLTKTGAGRLEINNSSNAATNKFIMKAGALTAPAPSRFGAPSSVVANFFQFDGGGFGANTTTAYDLGAFRGVTILGGGAFFGASLSTIVVTIGAPVVGTAGGDLTINGGAAQFVGSAHISSPTLILSNTNNSWNGNAIIGGGTLKLGAAGVIPDTAAVSVNSSTSTFDMNSFSETVGSIAGTGAGALQMSGNLTAGGNNTSTSVASVISGSGSLTKVGTGTLTLTGANTFTGKLNINTGVVAFSGTGANNANLGAASPTSFVPDAVTINGATLRSTNSAATGFNANRGFTIGAAGATLDITNATVTFAGAVTGSSLITKTGAGILVLSADNTASYTGKYVISGGEINPNNNDTGFGAVPGSFKADYFTLSGGGNIRGAAGYAINSNRGITLTGSGGGIDSTSGTMTYAGIIAGTSAFTKTGSGTLNLNTPNGYSGGTNLIGGSLNVNDNGAVGAGTITVNPTSSAATLRTNVTGPITLSNAVNILTAANASDFLIPQFDTLVLNGPISGAALVKGTGGGAGTLILGADNSAWAGGVQLKQGIISLGHKNALGSTALSVVPGAVLSGAGTPQLQANVPLTGANAIPNNITIATATGFTLTVNGTNDFDLAGNISDGTPAPGALLKSGTNTVTLLGTANTYTAGTTVSGGTLSAGVVNALPSGGAVVVSGGTMEIGSFGQAVGAVTLSSGSINGTTGVLTGSSYSVQSGSVSAILGGAGALTKTTSGTITLTAANTYSGGTTVSAGTLLINNTTGSGTGSGNVTVSAGTLGGTGSISGAVTVASGGHLAPGASVGTITVSALTLDSGSALDYELAAPSSGDLTVVTTPSTGLTLNGGAVNITDAGGLAAGTYTLIDYDTGFLGSLSNLFVNNAPAGFEYDLVNNGANTSIDLVVTTSTGGASIWKNDASGTWTPVSNWINGSPNAVGASALFGSAITAARTVTLDSGKTLGTATFDNANAYTLVGATLTLDNTSGSAALNVLSGNHTIAAPVALVDDATVTAAGGTTLTISGAVSGSSGLINAGAGTLLLSAPGNSYTGGTTINAGTVATGASDVLPNSGAINVNGGSLDIGGNSDTVGNVTLASGSITGSTGVLSGSSYSVQSGSISAILGGSGALTKTGSDSVTLSGANTYGGGTNVNAGTLAMGADNALPATGAVGVNGGTLDVGTHNTSSGAVTLASGSITGTTGVLSGSSYSVQSGSISAILGGSGALTKTGSDTVTLSGANTYGGGTNVNAGTLALGANNALPATGAVNVNGGTLDIAANSTSAGNVTLASGSITGTTGVLSGSSYNVQSGSVSAILGGSGALTKSGTDAVTLSAVNTYTGGSNVNAGTLITAVDNALPSGGAVGVAGGTLDIGATSHSAGAFTLASGAINGTTGVLSATSFDVQSGSASAILGGSSALTKSGAGVVTLTGANTYTGGTNVNAGTLALGANNALPAAGAVGVNGGTLDLGANSTSAGAVTLADGAISGTTGVLSGSSYTVQNGSVSAILGGSGGLTKSTTGSVTLSGANTYGGATHVNAGTLALGASDVLPDTTVLTVNGGTLDLGASSDTVAAAKLANGSITGTTGVLSAPLFTLENGSVSAIMGGSGALSKITPGTVTLTAANTYSGGTTISGGTLLVNNTTGSGTGSGAVTVNGGTLGGTGSIAGAITVNSGGHVAPGTSPGTFTTSALTLSSGAVLDFEVGTGGDKIVVTTPSTGLGLDSGTNTITVNVSSLPGFGLGSFELIDYDTAFTGSLASLGVGTAPAGFDYSFFNNTTTTAIDLVVSTQGRSWAVDASGNWSTGSNWAPPSEPDSVGAAVTFGNVISAHRTVTLDNGNKTVGTVVFNDADGYTLNGANTLILDTTGGDSAITVTDGSHSIENAVQLNKNVAVFVTAGNSLSVSGQLSGGAGLGVTKTGAGTLVLGHSANTYSGATNINGGVLSVGSSGALGDGSGTNIVTFDGGTFQTTAGLDNARNVTLNGGGGTIDTAGNTSSFSGVVSGSGSLTKINAGTLVLGNSANTYSGSTNINGGVLSVGSSGALGDGSATNGVNFDGGTLKTTADFDTGRAIALGAGGGTVDTDPSTVTFSGVVSGSGSLTKVNAGTLVLGNSANSYSGGTNVNGGSLVSGADNSLGSGNVSVAGGTLDVGATNNTVGLVTLSSGAINGTTGVLTGTSYSVQDGSISAILGGTGALTKSTTGSVTLSGANTYTGGSNVNAGSLILGANNVLADGGAVNVNGGTLDIGANSDSVGAVTLASGSIAGTTGVLSGASYDLQSGSVSAILGGSGAVTKSTAGTVTLSGANTYSGGTNVNAGTLALGANNALPATGAVDVNGGTLDIGANSTSAGVVTLVSGSITGTTGVLTGSSYAVHSGSISAILGGSGGLTKTTAGLATLSGANTYTGTTLVNAGTLALGASNVLADTGVVTVNGGTFDIGANSDSVGAVKLASGSITGTTGVLSANLFTMEDGSASAILGGSGTLTKTTAGTVFLSGANTYSGPTTINGGLLAAGASNNLGDGSATNTLSFDGGTLATTTGFDNPRAVTLNGGGGTVNTFGQTSSFSGAVSGSGSLTKAGFGTLVLSNSANSYSGATNITQGTLSVGSSENLGDASATNIVTLSNSAILNATGPIASAARNVTVVNSGVINSNNNAVTFGNVTGAGTLVTHGNNLTVNHVRAGGIFVGSGSLALAPDGGPAGVSVVGSTDVAPGARLDITNNHLIDRTSGVGSATGGVYDGLSGLIQSGRNGGGWGGSGIVTSQPDATTGNLTSIGIATAEQVKGLSGPTETAVWAGQTVTGSDSLVMYTYGGDANLDGKINVDDYGHIDSSISLGLSGWYNGDFNYDGKINIDDYGIIDFNIGIQGSPFFAAGGIAGTPGVAGMNGVSAVPEPTCVSLVTLGALALTGRRTRRNNRRKNQV